MSVRDELMKTGWWDVRLASSTADAVFDNIDYWDHVVITPQRVDPREHSDAAMLGMSIYTGIVVDRERDDEDVISLAGPSVTAHLGDRSDKGEIPLNRLSIDGQGFSAAIRAALGSRVTEGTFSDTGIAGTYTGNHDFETPRLTITYICSTMGGEFRVNPDGTIDAGTPDVLYGATPNAIMVREGSVGWDPNVETVPTSSLSTKLSKEEYVTEVYLLGSGAGTTIATGQSTPGSVPYKDIHGNTLVHRAAVNEPETVLDNADTRADVHLNLLQATSEAINLDSGEFLIDGPIGIGEWVWVYDPPLLWDSTNELEFRGDLIHPAQIRVVGLNWPIVFGYGVYVRDKNGGYTDISDFMIWEGGASQVIVGDVQRDIFGTLDVTRAATGARLRADEDFTVPDVPVHDLPWGTYSYLDSDGQTRAAIITGWLEPLNTDATAITDGDRYEIRWSPYARWQGGAWTELFRPASLSGGTANQATSAKGRGSNLIQGAAVAQVATTSTADAGGGNFGAGTASTAMSMSAGGSVQIHAAGVAPISVGILYRAVPAEGIVEVAVTATATGQTGVNRFGAGSADVASSAAGVVAPRLKLEAVELSGQYNANDALVSGAGYAAVSISASSGFGARLKLEAVELTGFYNPAAALISGAGSANVSVRVTFDSLFYSNTYYDDYGAQ